MTYSIIRKVEPQDVDQVVKLCSLHAEYEGSTYDKTGKEKKLRHAFFNEPSSAHCLVAESDGEILGYATATKEFSTWDADYYLHMDCLYILEKARGEGLGSRFIKTLKKLAYDNKCTHIQWQTPVDNEKAIRFYHKHGAMSRDKKRFFLDI
jgi:GNAT superfamily N-acetyltransferase